MTAPPRDSRSRQTACQARPVQRRSRPSASAGLAWRQRACEVLAATVLHNLEELLTLRTALSRPPLARLLQLRGVDPQRVWHAFLLLNGVVSGVATGAVLLGNRHGRPEAAGVVAATMLVNVAVPHVPAALLVRGYTPGLVTAVTVVLPVTSRYLLQAHGDGLLPRRDLVRCLGTGLVLVVLGVPSGLGAADRLLARGTRLGPTSPRPSRSWVARRRRT